MIVVDASAMVEALVAPCPDPALLDLLEGEIAAPHLLDVEVTSALRGLVLGKALTLRAAEEALWNFAEFNVDRYSFAPLAARVWELRDRYTSYDACYLALAEGLGVPLVTCDRKLTSRHAAQTMLFPRS